MQWSRFLPAGIVAATALAWVAPSSRADEYIDQASWLAHTSGMTTITFEGYAPDDSYKSYTAHGLTLTGVNFTSLYTASVPQHQGLWVIDDGFSEGRFDLGFGQVLAGAFSVHDQQTGTIIATLPAGVTSVGTDIGHSCDLAEPIVVTLFTAAGSTTFDYTTMPEGGFLGFTSPSPITSIRFTNPQSTGNDGYIMLDNFSFGTNPGPVSVPEPSAVGGMMVLAGGLLARRRPRTVAI
ncbi:MAG: hypothetical protein JWN24_3341 [Phycisphaerales bacterium]|jgi:hypothetical protein|nr:hypothetical protein [Phycisphaerales bacterium]